MSELVPGFDKSIILPPGGDILLKAAADVSAQILQEIVSVLLIPRPNLRIIRMQSFEGTAKISLFLSMGTVTIKCFTGYSSRLFGHRTSINCQVLRCCHYKYRS